MGRFDCIRFYYYHLVDNSVGGLLVPVGFGTMET
jgi:hypothetical protein